MCTKVQTMLALAITRKEINMSNILTTFPQLLSSNFPDDDYIVEPLFTRGELSLIVGAPDSGKSLWCLNLCIQLMLQSETVLGFPVPGKKPKILYCFTEDTQRKVCSRSTSILDELSVENPPDSFHQLFINDTDNFLFGLEELIGSTNYDIIVIDVFTDLLPVKIDIKDNTGVRNRLNAVKEFAQRRNCHIALIHHTGKGSYGYEPHKKNALGATAWIAVPRVVFEITKNPKEHNVFCLHVTKGNYLPDSIKSQVFKYQLVNDSMLLEYIGQDLFKELKSQNTLINKINIGLIYGTDQQLKKSEILLRCNKEYPEMSTRTIERFLERKLERVRRGLYQPPTTGNIDSANAPQVDSDLAEADSYDIDADYDNNPGNYDYPDEDDYYDTNEEEY